MSIIFFILEITYVCCFTAWPDTQIVSVGYFFPDFSWRLLTMRAIQHVDVHVVRSLLKVTVKKKRQIVLSVFFPNVLGTMDTVLDTPSIQDLGDRV